MASALKVGAHWAVIETVQAAGEDKWFARWALYTDLAMAMEVTSPEQARSAVSGTTRAFAREAEADDQAHADAARTERVLSGTYRA